MPRSSSAEAGEPPRISWCDGSDLRRLQSPGRCRPVPISRRMVPVEAPLCTTRAVWRILEDGFAVERERQGRKSHLYHHLAPIPCCLRSAVLLTALLRTPHAAIPQCPSMMPIRAAAAVSCRCEASNGSRAAHLAERVQASRLRDPPSRESSAGDWKCPRSPQPAPRPQSPHP